jgi:hypothetical protein
MIYVHSRIQMLDFSASVVAEIKLKTKCTFPIAAILLYVHSKKTINRIYVFFEYMLHTSLQDPAVTWHHFCSHLTISHIHHVVTDCRNLKVCVCVRACVRVWGGLQLHDVHKKTNQNSFSGSRLETCGQTARHCEPCLCSFCADSAKSATVAVAVNVDTKCP